MRSVYTKEEREKDVFLIVQGGKLVGQGQMGTLLGSFYILSPIFTTFNKQFRKKYEGDSCF